MIVKCPECGTSFMVPDEALAPEGRQVRCSSCRAEWFQPFEAKEEGGGAGENTSGEEGGGHASVAQQEESDISGAHTGTREELREENISETGVADSRAQPGGPSEGDIPEAVKPDKSEGDLAIPPVSRKGKWLLRGTAKLFIIMAVALLIVLIFSLSGRYVTKIWPHSIPYYQLLGFEYAVPGEDLVFDRVKNFVVLNEDGLRILKIEGKIINLSPQPRRVPAIDIGLLAKQDGKVLTRFTVKPEQEALEGEEVMEFQAEYRGELSPQASRLHLGFHKSKD